MYDAMALSVPFPQFSGYLDFGTDQRHRESTDEIVKLYEHLKKGESFQKLHFAIDLDRLNRDLQNGLYFNSNIPQQYGVGSSGALVAALFNRYAVVSSPVNGLEPTLLKNDFALLESYFHGRSSGVDPLISFLNHPLLIDSKKDVRTVNFDLQQSGLSVALIDTKTNSATEPLVQHFIDRFNDPIFEKAFESQFIPANNGCIESLLDGNKQVFFTFLEQLIRFELFHFQRMIPGDFHSVIQNALNDKIFVKLLGSGGGGFLLVFAETELHLRNWEEKSEISLQMITKSDQAISNHLIT
jgi:mevalonate kinase